MPPRKKTKLSAPAENAQSPAGVAQRTPSFDLATDPWTDEQETALLKGIIKWKPVGMHKHFRMVAISEYMKSQGYAPSHAEHTRIPGIWKKLGTLYNLPSLDEREDSFMTEMTEDVDSREVYCPFELPRDEYGDLMFERRFAIEGEGSPSPEPSAPPESRRGSTVADTDEARSSPAPSRGRKPGRGGRPAGRGTRSSRLQVEVENRPGSSTSEEDEDEDDEDESDEENEESEQEESEDAKEESEEDEGDGDTGSSPTGRSTRARASRSTRGSRRGGGVSRRGRRRQA
ncbi:chromatin modification-related protein EAF7-domain-containing protein [Aspergillus karnatakaensis]|uniref:uncharacterized protein n=1 Tax=Aspergillus karnatakaensis TaxID=1810916 RepID=UPI003CCC9EC7